MFKSYLLVIFLLSFGFRPVIEYANRIVIYFSVLSVLCRRRKSCASVQVQAGTLLPLGE